MSVKIDSSTLELNRHSTMSVSTFKSSVVRVRDILRGPGMSITGMDSMRHICLYLLSRYITVVRAPLFGVPETFAWETMLHEARTQDGGLQRAIDRFFHTETDCLVAHFDRLFGTEKFQFDVKGKMGLQKHLEILEVLDKVNMSEVDCEIDMLGWVYEQHLKTGSSSAGRDLGQFFTDRFICEYMTELCKPTFKHPGVPESVCDPSMGTGGFLTYYIKYFNKKYPGQVNWKVQEQVVHGNDTDPRVAGVARMNTFMETGGCCATNLRTHDSLYGDLTQTGYDVILANMPFGLKGIKHADCCERVKDLKIRGTKSEPLFLQLMMVSLNPGGRCAVVVPDGMLVNSSTCHDDTRKYLMDHFELKRVIKLKGKFFMNTGIQPSVLFFENTGKPTTAVEFWEVIKGEDGKVQEEMILSVPRERFTDACCLDVRKYQEVKVAANPAGFPVVKLGDVCNILSGKGNYTHDGDVYPYYDSNGITGTRKDYLYDGEYTVTARKMSIGAVHYVSGKYWASDNTINMTSRDTDTLNNRFLYYWLLLNNNKLKDLSSGIKPGIRKTDVLDIQMPLPPLAVQQEIVATLDRIYQPGTTELSETLKLTSRAMDLVLAQPNGTMLEPIVEAQRMMRKSAQMAADVKAQMAAIVKSVGCRGFPMVKLGDIVSFMNGFAFKTEEFIDSGVPIVKIKNIKNGRLSFEKVQYSKAEIKLIKYVVKPTDIVISLTGELSGDVGINLTGVEWYLNQRVARIDIINKDLNSNYLYYYMLYSDFTQRVRDISTGSAQPNVSTKNIEDFEITLPPLDFQQAVLVRLDALQSQLASLETLSKQAEDNARFILESYLGTA